MATPPRITHEELIEHLRLIAKRRHAVDDPHRELLPAADATVGAREVLDTLAYLRQYPCSLRGYRQADAINALQLNVWLWWEDRRRERHWLREGRRLNLFLTQLGAPFGVTSRRGVLDRIDRLEALLQYDRPNEQLSRAARRNARLAAANRDVENAWVTEHWHELDTTITALLEAADRFDLADEDREMLDELAADQHEQQYSPATMALLGLAVAEVATAPQVAELTGERAQPFTVHRVLAHIERLRSAFAALGKTAESTDAPATGEGDTVQPAPG